MILAAQWLGGGGPTIEWLMANPDWYEDVDICAIAVSQAEAQRAQDAQTRSSKASSAPSP